MKLEEIVKLYGFNDYLDQNTGHIYCLGVVIEDEYLAGTKASYDIPVIENDGSCYRTIGYAHLDNPNCAAELNPGRVTKQM